MGTQQPVLGLIAGEGVLPVWGARRLREAGRPLVCVAFRDLADPALAESVDDILWVDPGQVGEALAFLARHEVREAVLAGKVSKQGLLADPGGQSLDPQAEALLAALPDLRDQTLLRRVADLLAGLGIELLPQWSLDPALRVGPGMLGLHTPSAEQQRDIERGLPIALQLAGLDIGQSLVVHRGTVIAVEAVEGTDAMLRRAGALAPGGVAIKVARPNQDPRFDVPAIGPRTVEALAAARIEVLAFEARATLVLERDALVAQADAAGIAIVGVVPPGGTDS